MNEYFITTLSVALFLAVVDVLVSKTQNGKIVKSVISLILVTVLAVPIIKIIGNEDFNIENSFSTSKFEAELIKLEKEILTEKIESTLNDNEINFINVSVEMSSQEASFNVEKIIIKFSNSVIKGESERINMLDKVQKLLKPIFSEGDKIQIEIANE